MGANRFIVEPHGSSTYEVHWVLNVSQGRAGQYGKAIRQAWWTFRGVAGERKLSCDYAADVVVVVLGLASDDLSQAIDETRSPVIGPLVGAGLPLPESVVVIATTNERRTAKRGAEH
jgi:hypothetical protein